MQQQASQPQSTDQQHEPQINSAVDERKGASSRSEITASIVGVPNNIQVIATQKRKKNWTPENPEVNTIYCSSSTILYVFFHCSSWIVCQGHKTIFSNCLSNFIVKCVYIYIYIHKTLYPYISPFIEIFIVSMYIYNYIYILYRYRYIIKNIYTHVHIIYPHVLSVYSKFINVLYCSLSIQG